MVAKTVIGFIELCRFNLHYRVNSYSHLIEFRDYAVGTIDS